MIAYKKYVVIENPNRVVLSDLPFRAGQTVEIVMMAQEDRPALSQEWQSLFTTIQSLPQATSMTDDDIAAEIAAYRSAR